MATRRPLVNVAGALKEVPAGDTLPPDTDPRVPWRTRGANFYRAAFDGTCAATAGSIHQSKYYTPYDVYEAFTIDRWAIFLQIVGVGGTQNAALALYAADPTTNLPTGSDVLGLATVAPVIDLNTGVAGSASESATFAAPLTIPVGRYWYSVRVTKTGQSTAASIAYIPKHDRRIPGSAPVALAYTSGMTESSTAAAGGTAGTVAANYGVAVWLRQTS